MNKGEKVAYLAILVNLFLFAIKYFGAEISGSIALKAEAFHTMADLIASLSILGGLKIAKRKSKLFPYGLYKVENLMSVIISLVVFYTGYEIIVDTMSATTGNITNSAIAIGCLILSIIITFIFSRYEKQIGEEINSPILLADAEHIHMDILSNAIVLVAVISSYVGYSFDKIAAIIVVCFIIKTGVTILKNGIKVLLDASIDYETLSKVEKIITNTHKVAELIKLSGRNSGRFKFIEATIRLETGDLDEAHCIADKIESDIKNKVRNIDEVLIHYEPTHKNETIYAVPLTSSKEKIHEHFGEAPYFMIARFKLEDKIASKVELLENPYYDSEKSKGILTAEFLSKQKVDKIISRHEFNNKGPLYVFSDAKIEIILTKQEFPKEAFSDLGLKLI